MMTALAELHDIVGPVPLDDSSSLGWPIFAAGLFLLAVAVGLLLWRLRRKQKPEPVSAQIQKHRVDLLQAEADQDPAALMRALLAAISCYTRQPVSSRTPAELRALPFAGTQPGKDLIACLERLEQARYSGAASRGDLQQIRAQAGTILDQWTMELRQKELAESRGGRR